MTNRERSRPFELGEWLVQPQDGTIRSSDGEEVRRLEPRVMALLDRLAATPGEVVSKEELLEAVWGEAWVEEGALSRCVSDIRRALGDRASSPSYIETLPKRGYRLIADLRRSPEPDTEPDQRAPRASIAVLPFLDLSPARDHQYFADGLAEELIHALAQIRGVHVAARTSSFQFRSSGADVREVARQLAVSTIVEGSVRREGDRLRIAVQLIDATNGYHLLSQRYDRSIDSLFEVQDEIATALVAHTQPELLPHEASVARNQRNVGAYDLCLQAWHLVHQGTPETVAESVQIFRRAVESDPESAEALAGLAAALTASVVLDPSRRSRLVDARDAARRALDLGDDRGKATLALAAVELFEWKWEAALELCRRAESITPGSALAHFTLQYVLQSTGRLDEALEHARLACELSPLGVNYHRGLGTVLLMQRKWSEALTHFDRVVRLNPQTPFVGLMAAAAHWCQGEWSRSIEALAPAVDPQWAAPSPSTEDEARRQLLELVSRWRNAGPDGLWFFVAVFDSLLDRREAAMAALESAVNSREPAAINLKAWPTFDALRESPDLRPRFHELLKRAGLADPV